MSKSPSLLRMIAPLVTLLAACGEQEGRGVIVGSTLPESVLSDKAARQSTVSPAGDSLILFGDLHVHTTFSPDAFIMSMPLQGGSGLHPPADACDFARYCSALDFWSINDHAEGITPRRWSETRESIRECNAASGDPQHPDMVSFLGWKSSQVSTDPDCFNEPMDHRPLASAQYAMAISGFGGESTPLNFRFGLIGSSDNHRGQAGTGYKEVRRKFMTEAFGPDAPRSVGSSAGDKRDPLPYSVPMDGEDVGLVNARNMERQNSFWLTGGLVATHSTGRDRYSIWDSLKRRQVYATSGDRILLWFDLLQGKSSSPMGSEVTSSANPHFRVSAVGAFKQQPGCPEHTYDGLGAERVQSLCGGECYNPGDERYRIDRLEVVRIRPQVEAGEDVGQLIEDPWRSFECDGDPVGCSVEFSDDEFLSADRDALYYVRAIQETTAMINADNLRCEYDENGVCVEVSPCYGDYRTPGADDCLAPAQQRAWSSPIFVSPGDESPGTNEESR